LDEACRHYSQGDLQFERALHEAYVVSSGDARLREAILGALKQSSLPWEENEECGKSAGHGEFSPHKRRRIFEDDDMKVKNENSGETEEWFKDWTGGSITQTQTQTQTQTETQRTGGSQGSAVLLSGYGKEGMENDSVGVAAGGGGGGGGGDDGDDGASKGSPEQVLKEKDTADEEDLQACENGKSQDQLKSGTVTKGTDEDADHGEISPVDKRNHHSGNALMPPPKIDPVVQEDVSTEMEIAVVENNDAGKLLDDDAGKILGDHHELDSIITNHSKEMCHVSNPSDERADILLENNLNHNEDGNIEEEFKATTVRKKEGSDVHNADTSKFLHTKPDASSLMSDDEKDGHHISVLDNEVEGGKHHQQISDSDLEKKAALSPKVEFVENDMVSEKSNFPAGGCLGNNISKVSDIQGKEPESSPPLENKINAHTESFHQNNQIHGNHRVTDGSDFPVLSQVNESVMEVEGGDENMGSLVLEDGSKIKMIQENEEQSTEFIVSVNQLPSSTTPVKKDESSETLVNTTPIKKDDPSKTSSVKIDGLDCSVGYTNEASTVPCDIEEQALTEKFQGYETGSVLQLLPIQHEEMHNDITETGDPFANKTSHQPTEIDSNCNDLGKSTAVAAEPSLYDGVGLTLTAQSQKLDAKESSFSFNGGEENFISEETADYGMLQQEKEEGFHGNKPDQMSSPPDNVISHEGDIGVLFKEDVDSILEIGSCDGVGMTLTLTEDNKTQSGITLQAEEVRNHENATDTFFDLAASDCEESFGDTKTYMNPLDEKEEKNESLLPLSQTLDNKEGTVDEFARTTTEGNSPNLKEESDIIGCDSEDGFLMTQCGEPGDDSLFM